MVTTNALAKENNDIAANNYIKPTGTLFLNDPSLGLQVSANAIVAGYFQVVGTSSRAYVQNNLTVGGQLLLTNTWTTVISTGNAIYANNVLVNSLYSNTTIIAPNILGGNVTANTLLTSSTLNNTGKITTVGLQAQRANVLVYLDANSATGNFASLIVNGITLNGNAVQSIYIVGTPNQTTVSAPYGNVTISTPQNTDTRANIQFNSIGVGTPASSANGEIRATGAVVSGYSDDRLKINHGTILNALEKVSMMDGFYYTPNELALSIGIPPREVPDVGMSAQQVNVVLPEAIVPSPINPEYYTIRYERLVPLLVEAIKELQQEIAALKGK
jgi:hypothetical protein